MSRWFRHYAGLCRDDKLVSAAIKAKQPVERVVWVWAAILESAAELDDAGRYGLDPAEAAYFLRTDEADIRAIEDALSASGRVADGVVVNWGKRQFRSDRSAERVAAHRERKRSEGTGNDGIAPSQNDAVTLQSRHCNSPETETETEKKSSLRSDSTRARLDAGEALLLEAGVQPETIREWKLTRRAKRAGPITPLVSKGQLREAAAAGWTPESATLICIERGWQAFRAEYVSGNRQTGPPRASAKLTAGDAAAEIESLLRGQHASQHSDSPREPSAPVPRLAYSAGR